MFTLTVIDETGRLLHAHYVVDDVTLGRDPSCDLVLADRRLAPRQLQLSDLGDRIVLASRSPGLNVDGRERTGRIVVEPGQTVSLFRYRLTLSHRHLPDDLQFLEGADLGDASEAPSVDRLWSMTREGDAAAASQLYRVARRRDDLALAIWAVPLAEPGPLAWRSLVLGLSVLTGDLLDDLVAHASRWLSGWPDALRVAPATWWGNVVHGAPERRWPLVRSLAVGPGRASVSEILSVSEAAALCEHPSMSVLSCLALAGKSVEPGLVRRVVDAEVLAGLRHLDLSGCRLTPATMAALAHGRVLAGLKSLTCAQCDIDDEGATALARAPALRGLERLDLASNAIGDAGGRALARSPNVTGLAALDLRGNPIGADAAALLRTTVRLRPGALRLV